MTRIMREEAEEIVIDGIFRGLRRWFEAKKDSEIREFLREILHIDEMDNQLFRDTFDAYLYDDEVIDD
jgi:hypothetical protein